ncbi:histidinol-phosphatase [soil metagenome]
MSLHTDHLSLACRLADVAASHSMRSFRTALDVDVKSDASPVTIADRAAEAAMRALLAVEAPAHGILGEEHGSERLDAEYVWVLDPIDGTKSYITGSPLWGTLIALTHHGRPVLGLIDMPVLGERWIGGAGVAARRNGEAVRVRHCTQLAQARILTTSPDSFSPPEWQAYDALSRRCAMRRFGGDCYGYAQLAGGHVDLVAECGLQPYDYMALVGVVEAAGGVISDWEGRPLSIHSDGRVLAAATAQLHGEALQMLRPLPEPQPV